MSSRVNDSPPSPPSEEEQGESSPAAATSKDLAYKIKGGAFLSLTAGIAALAGFGGALAAARKQESRSLEAVGRSARLHADGVALAARALAWGSLAAVAGCGVVIAAIWRISGAPRDFAEFRRAAGGVLPRLPRSDPPVGRTEFTGLNDLLNHLIDRDKDEHAARRAVKKDAAPED